jgi:antitoxin component HigA of HigAB toxin-antitoxin module
VCRQPGIAWIDVSAAKKIGLESPTTLLRGAPAGWKNSGEFDDEIEVLTTLIEQYEERFARIDAPDPIAAIKFRMEEKGLTPRQLESFIGSRARVSEVLSGKRSLCGLSEQAAGLSKRDTEIGCRRQTLRSGHRSRFCDTETAP